MTTASPPLTATTADLLRPDNSRAWDLRRFGGDSPELTFGAVFFLLLIPPTVMAMGLDDRLYQGINVWIKPLKFLVSLTLFLGTLAYVVRWLPTAIRSALWFRLGMGLAVLMAILEIIWIAGAAGFGAGSHFNVSTPFMGLVYGFMGFAAVTLTASALLIGILLWRHKSSGLPPVVRTGIGSGLVLTFFLTLITAGYMASTTGHFVGGNRLDVEAIPILGWALDGGDLRVSHFFATHAMQALPLAALVIHRTVRDRWRLTVLAGAALTYTGLVAYTFYEALLGKPFLALIF